MNKKVKEIISKEKLEKSDIVYLQNLLKNAADLYYNTNRKLMSDTEFDEISDVLSKYTDIAVGSNVKGQINIVHKYPELVGSLNKVSDINLLMTDFLEPLVGNEKISGFVSLKIDGNSIAGSYTKDGKSIKHLTRGSNGKGKDLSKVFNHIELNANFDKPFGVKYEAIVTYEKFNEALETLNISYASPRSFVSGKLHDDDAHLIKDLFTLVPIGFTFGEEEPMPIRTQYKYIEKLFPLEYKKFIEPYSLEFINFTPLELVAELTSFHDIVFNSRESLDFMIDGIVLEIDNEKYRKLPAVNHRPKHAVAIKFPYMEKESTVIGFEFDLSQSFTGIVTPIILFKPVTFNGAVQKRVSISNYKRFKELQLSYGSPVLIEYHGDTLSYLTKLEDPRENVEPHEFITNCPICDTELETKINDKGEETFKFCPNYSCYQKVSGRIVNYLETLEIKGIKKATIDKIFDYIDIQNPSDLYLLDKEILSEVKGFKEKTIDNILNAIYSTNPMDYEILAGLGITNFKRSKSKLLLNKVTLEELFEDFHGEMYYKTEQFANLFLNIEGFSDKTLSYFVSELEQKEEELFALIQNIKNAGLTINRIQDMQRNNSTESLTFVITGSIENWKNRNELKKELENLGHKVTGSVTSNTNYLINNDTMSSSSKNKKAKELGVSIISEIDLINILGLSK